MGKAKVLTAPGRFYSRTAHGEAELLYDVSVKGTMRIYHTYVPDGDRGLGMADALARVAFRFAKANGMKVKPDCPYITHFLKVNKGMRKYLV